METITMKLADKLTKQAIENGGATLNRFTAEDIKDGYTIGGGILKTADALATFDAEDEMLQQKIYWTLLQNRKALENFEAVGIWNSNGVIYLDATTVETNLIKAVVLGLSRDQQAIGSLTAGRYEELTLSKTI